MSRTYRILVLLLTAWLLGWIVLSWPAMQDDALIHLRYADHLLHQHIISYNGSVRDFGSSSLLYVALLAVLRTVSTSPLLPRAVSTTCHLLLFAGLWFGFVWAMRQHSQTVTEPVRRLAELFVVLLLALLVAPSAVRWLDDGMETSLGLCLVALTAFLTSRPKSNPVPSAPQACGLAVLGFFAVLLRIEFLLLLTCASLLLAAQMPQHAMPRVRALVRCAAPIFGGVLGALFIVVTMHHLLPDTALAKSTGLSYWRSSLGMTAETFASSLSFGLVSLALWLLSGAALLLSARRRTLPVLVANSLFPCLLVVSALRGQAIQGIRYFEWTLLFSIAWNTLEALKTPELALSTERWLRWTAFAVAALYLLAAPLESRLFLRVFRLREAAIGSLRAQHLERLRSVPVTAFDVGFIGYFSQSQVCDLGGLVNGRAIAAASYAGRIEHCAVRDPRLAFGSVYQLDDLNTRVDLSQWSVCAVYDLANLHASDLHYLIAAPSIAAEVCAVTGGVAQPLAPLLGPSANSSLVYR